MEEGERKRERVSAILLYPPTKTLSLYLSVSSRCNDIFLSLQPETALFVADVSQFRPEDSRPKPELVKSWQI